MQSAINKNKSFASRSWLIGKVREMNSDLPPEKITEIFMAVIHTMTQGLSEGRDIEIRQLGIWRVRTMAQKKAHNPKTGEKMQVEGRQSIRYKNSRPLTHLLNPHLKKETP